MSDKIYIGNNVSDFDTGESQQITKVKIVASSESTYIAGDDTGKTIEFKCSWGSQAMADSILRKLSGKVYQPYNAPGALLDPAAELGDAATISGKYLELADMEIDLDHMCAADTSFPGTDEIEDEYPYKSQQEREIERSVGTTLSMIKKTNEYIELSVKDITGKLGQTLRLDPNGVTITNAQGTALEIDGGQLKANSVTADQINAQNLQVDAANIIGELRIGSLPSEVPTKSYVSSEIYSSEQNINREIQNAGYQTSSDVSSAIASSETNVINTINQSIKDAGYQDEKGITSIVKGTVTTDYVNALGITAGKISADNIVGGRLDTSALLIDGMLFMYDHSEYMGYMGGSAGAGDTSGMVIAREVGGSYPCYFIATQTGVRMTCSIGTGGSISCSSGGCWSTSTIHVTSDRRKKKDIDYDMSRYDELFDGLKSCSFRYRETPERLHFGMIAQDLVPYLSNLGMDERTSGVLNMFEDRYTIGYTEIIPLLVTQVQKLKDEVKALKEGRI